MFHFDVVSGSLCCATILGILAITSFRSRRRGREVMIWNTFCGTLISTLPSAPGTPDSVKSPAAAPAHGLLSFPLTTGAITETALDVPPPTPMEQAAWESAVQDMWRAAEVGYAEHLQLLMQAHGVPADFRPPGCPNTLLLAAAAVQTHSAVHDRDLAAVLRLLLARGARATQAQRGTGATALHVLVQQPQEFEIEARLIALLSHIGATPSGAGNALEAMDRGGRLAEDVAVAPRVREGLERLRVMIDLRARR